MVDARERDTPVKIIGAQTQMLIPFQLSPKQKKKGEKKNQLNVWLNFRNWVGLKSFKYSFLSNR